MEYYGAMQGTEKRVKLSVWARAHGLTSRSARQMMSFGSLPAEPRSCEDRTALVCSAAGWGSFANGSVCASIVG